VQLLCKDARRAIPNATGETLRCRPCSANAICGAQGPDVGSMALYAQVPAWGLPFSGRDGAQGDACGRIWLGWAQEVDGMGGGSM